VKTITSNEIIHIFNIENLFNVRNKNLIYKSIDQILLRLNIGTDQIKNINKYLSLQQNNNVLKFKKQKNKIV